MEKVLEKLFCRENLTEDESYTVFDDILQARVSPEKISAFLALLKIKGEEAEEIAGAARLLRDKSIKIHTEIKTLCDTCGTGGDHSGTFNISTSAALLAFACGLKVAKHGNRSITSKCGSADVLEALGYKIDAAPEISQSVLNKYGFAFLFAPLYHKAMKNVMPVRKELPFRTIFNLIGPLCNPASTNVQIMGVSEHRLLKVIPDVFRRLGIRGYVFHSADGSDEISLTGKTYIVEVLPHSVKEFEIYPADFQFAECSCADIKGGSAEENAEIIKNILQNIEKGPRRDIVILNTSFLLKAAGAVKDIEDGRKLCIETLQNARPYDRFQEVLQAVNR